MKHIANPSILKLPIKVTVAPSPDMIDWIMDNMSPDDVFNRDQLTDWAEVNGFVKKSDIIRLIEKLF